MRGRISAVAVVLVVACALAGCDGGSSDDVDPTPTGPSGLPVLEDGRLVRVLGDGTGDPMRGVEFSPDTRLSGPLVLAPGTGDALVGVQENFPPVFMLSADGTAQTLTEDEDVAFAGSRPLAVLAYDESLLVLSERDGEANVGQVLLGDDTAFADVTSLTGPGSESWAAALLPLPDAVYVQWEGGWWRLTGSADRPSGAERVDPPVPGVVASARSASGVSVLTDSELVHLDESLQVVERYPWRVPEGLESQTVTSAVSDGAGGLFVTMAGLTSDLDNGSVVHVTPDGASVLAVGVKPSGTEPSTSCDDADVAAQRAHLSRPVSVAVWQERLMIADEDCNSVLQLPLPE